MTICSFIIGTIKHPKRRLFRLLSCIWDFVLQIFYLIVDAVPIPSKIDNEQNIMSQYILTFLFLIPWLSPSSMSPLSAESATNNKSTHKSTKSCNCRSKSPSSSPRSSPRFSSNQPPKAISFQKSKSKVKDIQHGFNMNMAIRCFFSPGTVIGILSLSLTRLILLFCEYYYCFKLIYPSYHSYLLACIISKIFECYWYSFNMFGKEWQKLSFPKKFYMNGIPSQFNNDPSPHLIAFGFNILMTLVIAQLLVFCNYTTEIKVNPIIFGLLLGLLIIAINGRDHAFCRRPLKLFYINQAHSMLQCVLISAILTYV